MNLIHLYLRAKGESVCHSNNNDQPTILPLWFWAAQTSAAIIQLNIGNTESLVKPTPTPHKAARAIQHVYRQYRHRLTARARTIAAWKIQLRFRRYQFKQYAARITADLAMQRSQLEYEIFCQQSCINIDVSSDYVTTNTPTIAERPINDVSSDYVTTNTPTLTSRLGTSLGILCSTVKNEVHYKLWK